MPKEPPLRAQPDYRLVDTRLDEPQGALFDDLDGRSDQQLLADYRQRYGLAEDPFANDHSFPLFTAGGRRQLLDQLLHLCQFSNSLLLVLGEYGVGKTRIAHAFADSLSESDTLCFITAQAGQALEQLLLAIVQAFQLPLAALPTAENLLSLIEDFVGEEGQLEDEGLAVVVVDDAHLLDDKTLGVISSLLQSFPQQNRLHFACFGEPALFVCLERLGGDALLINDFNLQPFSLAEATDYLNFRMEMADYLGPEIFTEPMVDSWWRQAQGELRVLHELAQERLLESVMPKRNALRRPLPLVHIIAISVLITFVGVLFLYMDTDDKPRAAAVTAAASALTKPIAVPIAATSTPHASNLARTDTPVEPILPSLPAQSPVEQPNQPQALAVAPEQVIPLAELPTSSRKPVLSDKPVLSKAAVFSAEVTATQVPAPLAQVQEPTPTSAVRAAEVLVAPQARAAKSAPPADMTQDAASSVPAAPPLASTATTRGKTAQEKVILAWPASHYTIQLLGVSNAKAALDYMAQQPNHKQLLMFKSKRLGKDWYVVIAGHYASTALARQAIAQLPSAQRDAGPWPRDLKSIQQEIRALP